MRYIVSKRCRETKGEEKMASSVLRIRNCFKRGIAATHPNQEAIMLPNTAIRI